MPARLGGAHVVGAGPGHARQGGRRGGVAAAVLEEGVREVGPELSQPEWGGVGGGGGVMVGSLFEGCMGAVLKRYWGCEGSMCRSCGGCTAIVGKSGGG